MLSNKNLKARWPVTYNNKEFSDRLYLLEHLLINNINKIPYGLFLHSNIYYIRAALEYKFKREFSYKELQDYIKYLKSICSQS